MAHKLFIKYDASGGVWELYEQVDDQTIEWLGAFDTREEADNMRHMCDLSTVLSHLTTHNT